MTSNALGTTRFGQMIMSSIYEGDSPRRRTIMQKAKVRLGAWIPRRLGRRRKRPKRRGSSAGGFWKQIIAGPKNSLVDENKSISLGSLTTGLHPSFERLMKPYFSSVGEPEISVSAGSDDGGRLDLGDSTDRRRRRRYFREVCLMRLGGSADQETNWSTVELNSGGGGHWSDMAAVSTIVPFQSDRLRESPGTAATYETGFLDQKRQTAGSPILLISTMPSTTAKASTEMKDDSISRTSWKRVADERRRKPRSKSVAASGLNSSSLSSPPPSTSSSGDDIYYEQWTESTTAANQDQRTRKSDVVREEYHERVVRSSDLFPSSKQDRVYVQRPGQIEMSPSETKLYSDVLRLYDGQKSRRPIYADDDDLENIRRRILRSIAAAPYSSSSNDSDRRDQQQRPKRRNRNKSVPAVRRTVVLEEEEEEEKKVFETTTTTTTTTKMTTTTTTKTSSESSRKKGVSLSSPPQVRYYAIPVEISGGGGGGIGANKLKFRNITLHKIECPSP